MLEKFYPSGWLMRSSSTLTDTELLQFLKENPTLRSAVEEMIEISSGPKKLDVGFDDAEDAVVDYMNRRGNEMLQHWAQKASDSATEEALKQGGRHHEKKRS
jgi:hypothetical protein